MALDRSSVAVGEFLTGNLHWVAEEGEVVRAIDVVVFWQTDGAGNIARGIARGARFQVKAGQREGDFPLRLLIPYEGPISFQGELVSVVWKLRARIDRKGLDEAIETEFVVTVRKRAGADVASSP